MRAKTVPLDQGALLRRFVTKAQHAKSAPDPTVGKFLEAHTWLAKVPAKIRERAITDLVRAAESNQAKAEAIAARTKQRRKHRWRLHFRRRCDPSAWTITVDRVCIRQVTSIRRPCTRLKNDAANDATGRRTWTSVTLFPTFLRTPLLLTREVAGGSIDGAVKLTRSRRGNFYMHIPHKVAASSIPAPKPEEERKVVALDPGVRSFMTGYAPEDGCSEYCADGANEANNMGANVLSSLMIARDAVVSELARKGLTNLRRKELTRRRDRLSERCRDLTSDLHRRVAHDLLTRYDTVILPVFRTQGMSRRKNEDGRPRKLKRSTVRKLLGLRHYAFRQTLVGRAEMLGKEVCIVGEEFTTQTCGRCGRLHPKIGGNKTFVCPDTACGYRCDRDANAARNIFIKHLRA